jgi:uncharacterized protein (DUF1015 family)
MLTVKPFRAIRPVKDKVHLIPSRNFISYSKKDLSEKLTGNPYTFIHIINPEFGSPQKTKPNSPARFKKINQKFQEFRNEGYFQKDEVHAFYLYRQITPTNSFLGVIGAISVNDYLDGKIKVHEHTLSAREEMFAQYLKVTGFNAEPVLLMHQKNDLLNKIYASNSAKTPEYDFTTTDRIRHTLWVIQNKTDLNNISKAFKSIPSVYIADGHHRSASSAVLAQKFRKTDKNPNPDKAYNYCLAYFIEEEQLAIKGFHRIVKDLNNLSLNEFLQKLSVNFEITPLSEFTEPKAQHEFVFYCEKKWFNLKLKTELINFKSPDEALDPAILTDFILKPILNISDLKTDKRIQFAGGNLSVNQILKPVNNNLAKAVFFLHPVKPNDIKAVADNNLIMPPKSTWIEPKLRSGLTILPLNDD